MHTDYSEGVFCLIKIHTCIFTKKKECHAAQSGLFVSVCVWVSDVPSLPRVRYSSRRASHRTLIQDKGNTFLGSSRLFKTIHIYIIIHARSNSTYFHTEYIFFYPYHFTALNFNTSKKMHNIFKRIFWKEKIWNKEILEGKSFL